MSLSPAEYTKLKGFRDLIHQTMERLTEATSQGALSQAAGDLAPRWKEVDAEFSTLLTDVGASVWKMPFPQVRPTVQAIIGHLGQQRAEIDEQLAG
ncbi:MAG: hypothetical protein ACI9MR_001351 [Myxococcota bacterium]|jgi:hypothetical protein